MLRTVMVGSIVFQSTALVPHGSLVQSSQMAMSAATAVVHGVLEGAQAQRSAHFSCFLHVVLLLCREPAALQS